MKTCHLLGILYVNVSIYPNKSFVIPETGKGGYAVSGDWFHIYIDPTRPERELTKIITKNIPSTVYHELNHVARWNSVGYGSTLPEAIVTEGLATIFAEENWGEFKIPWSSYSSEEIEKLLDIVRRRKKNNDANYNHKEWFYGAGEIPRWAGYKIGTYIVKSFRKKHIVMDWIKIVKMSAGEIIRLSGVKLE